MAKEKKDIKLNFNFGDAVSQWHASRCFNIVFGTFYKKTGKKASILFEFTPEIENQISVHCKFSEALTDEEFHLFHILVENYDILANNMLTIEKLANYDLTKDLNFKLNEDSQQIFQKYFS